MTLNANKTKGSASLARRAAAWFICSGACTVGMAALLWCVCLSFHWHFKFRFSPEFLPHCDIIYTIAFISGYLARRGGINAQFVNSPVIGVLCALAHLAFVGLVGPLVLRYIPLSIF